MRLKFSNGWTVVMGALFLTVGAMVSCDEELPPVIMTEEEKPLLDTFYIGSVPAASVKKVLLFDVTGVRCNNCPKAAVLAKNLASSNSGRVEVVALYPKTPMSLTFPWAGVYADTWVFWLVYNVLKLYQNILFGNVAFVAKYIFYLVNAVMAWRVWHFVRKTESTPS